MVEVTPFLRGLKRDYKNRIPVFTKNGSGNKVVKAKEAGYPVLGSLDGISDFAVPGSVEDEFQAQFSLLPDRKIDVIRYRPIEGKPPITVLSAAIKVLYAANLIYAFPDISISAMQTDSAYSVRFEGEAAKAIGSREILLNKPASEEGFELMMRIYNLASLHGGHFISSSGDAVLEFTDVPTLKTGLIEVDLGKIRSDLDMDSLEHQIKENLTYAGGIETVDAVKRIVTPNQFTRVTFTEYEPFDVRMGLSGLSDQSLVWSGSFRCQDKTILNHSGFFENPKI